MVRYTIALLVLAACVCSAAATDSSLLVEAETLESVGGFAVLDRGGGLVYLGEAGGAAPAVGAVRLPAAGVWRLWVHARTSPAGEPGQRVFTVRIGGTDPKTFGRHKPVENGEWPWEDGGTLKLPAGPTLVVIGETNAAGAECDALILTRDLNYQPSGLTRALKIPQAEPEPLRIDYADPGRGLEPEPLGAIGEEPLETIGNSRLRLSFHRAGEAVALRAAVREQGWWRNVILDGSAERYRVIRRPKDSDPGLRQKLSGRHPFPAWDLSLSPKVRASAGGASVETQLGPDTAPWLAGRAYTLRPSAVKRLDGEAVELSFPPVDAGQLKATWRIEESDSEAKLTLEFRPKGAGHFSLGYHAPVSESPQATDFMLLSFMYHGHRFPLQPLSMLNAITPLPAALVNRGNVSYAVLAEPKEMPFEWYTVENSRYAFGIRNQNGQAQPHAYTPVLGQPGSVSDGSGPVTGKLRFHIQPGGWYAAYRDIATRTFNLRDYRRPTYASISDAALNILDLLRNDKVNGWDPYAKGPWNIESRNTVSQSSPLTYMSYYLLTGDETFYRKYALPTLEYLISRPSQHFCGERETGRSYSAHRPLGGPVSFYGATVYAGAYAMTHGKAPAFGEFCLKPGKTPASRGGTHPDPFEDALALYWLTGENTWLQQAKAGADRYIAEHIDKLPEGDVGVWPFIPTTFTPNWEGLLHMYEATGEQRYLDSAAEGARWLLTSFWIHPLIPDEEVTIHPGGVHDHFRRVWFYGNRRYRLGMVDEPIAPGDDGTGTAKELPPVTRLPEKKVPAWQVSNVGLGLEQPFTYPRLPHHANITMSMWAPNMERLAKLTGDSLFRTAARNGTIGRFGNYPGYYIDGHTDFYQTPDYPVKGPDITVIYQHHMPVFAAYVLDYLFTETEIRSRGEVAFPWVRQNGYVWFDNRLRGHAPGKVYGETAWPWLHRTAASADTVNVDVVLAHGNGKFHVILTNQVNETQPVRVRFDPTVLGRDVEGATLKARLNNQPVAPVKVTGGHASLELTPLGIAALTLDGVNIDVPTHRVAPPDHLQLPAKPAIERKPIPGSEFEAVGTMISAPPFESRQLYVYVAAGIDQCGGANLLYSVGGGPEKKATVNRYPCEFSVPLDDVTSPVNWRVESVQPAEK